jgi:hypothetical protein
MGDLVGCAPCEQCGVLTRSDCLDDISDVVALAGSCCEGCAATLVSEAHDDEQCTCRYCEIDRVRVEAARRAAEARVFGGLRLVGLVVDNDV